MIPARDSTKEGRRGRPSAVDVCAASAAGGNATGVTDTTANAMGDSGGARGTAGPGFSSVPTSMTGVEGIAEDWRVEEEDAEAAAAAAVGGGGEVVVVAAAVEGGDEEAEGGGVPPASELAGADSVSI